MEDKKNVQGAAPVAIVGWGTAGVNAAIALRRAGYDGRIVAFSDSGEAPYSPILTSYYVAGEKAREECFPWSDDMLGELRVDVVGERVVAVDAAAHEVRTGDGAYPFAKCLVATGAHPVTAGFPADCGYEPLVLRTLADADRMKAAFSRKDGLRVLVSGASMIALKCVEAALARGCAVNLVGMADHVLDLSALPQTAARFERGLAAQGVQLRLGQTIAGVQAEGKGDERVLHVTFSNGDAETFDEIVVAHGVRSDLGIVAASDVAIDRGIVVDDFMRTSAADVFAAGDVAQARELVTGGARVLGIWKAAAQQGAVAGAAMAAELAGREPEASCAWPGMLAANTIAVGGTLFISAGWLEAGENREVDVRESADMTVARIFADMPDGARRLVGYNVAADDDVPGSAAYDTAAMLTLRIEEEARAAARANA